MARSAVLANQRINRAAENEVLCPLFSKDDIFRETLAEFRHDSSEQQKNTPDTHEGYR